MDGIIVKLKCQNETKYYLPLTSGQAVILDNGMTLQAEIADFIKTSEVDSLVRGKVLLQSPNGTIYEITIDDSGKLLVNMKEQHINVDDYMFLDFGALDIAMLGDEQMDIRYLSLDVEELNGSKIG